jgi:hypothetical protein
MGAPRYILLGLAPARSAWFRNLGHWATSGVLPAEFLKCVSAEEVRARLLSGRPFSALVADAGLPAVDRDLLAAAQAAGCAPLVVDDGRVARDWLELGAVAVLPGGFDRDDLVGVLGAHARPIARGEADTSDLASPVTGSPSGWRCPVVALTGPGGTGVSTATIALAQALGNDVRHGGLVCLVDLRLRAEQAMLHDAGDVLPSVQELVEAHRSGQPSAEEVRAQTFAVEARNYHLLLGLRHARFWSALRRRAFEAAFDSLQRAYRMLVCDVDPDLEGEDQGGSIDVEERNVMARTAIDRADVVLAVGLPSMKGLHGLVRVVSDLIGFGVPPERLVPVVNRAPRSPRARAALVATLAELAAPAVGGPGRADGRSAARGLPAPLFLPERRVDEALHDGAPLPAALGMPLAGAVTAVMERAAPGGGVVPERVRPGTLGRWAATSAEAAG